MYPVGSASGDQHPSRWKKGRCLKLAGRLNAPCHTPRLLRNSGMACSQKEHDQQCCGSAYAAVLQVSHSMDSARETADTGSSVLSLLFCKAVHDRLSW
jgi:hypothetical protein